MEIIITILEYTGLFAFAASGAMKALKKHIDLFGIIFIGITTALGGGVIRDVLLGSTPPVMFVKYSYVLVAAVTSVAIFILAFILDKKGIFPNIDSFGASINIFDAIGLGVFTVLGVNMAMESGYSDNILFCVFLGLVTGIGGGMLRDIMLADVPFVLRKKIYALASIAGAVVFYLLSSLNFNHPLSLLIGVLTVFIIRILATVFEWNLPKI